jgi:pimeloyl-ACP methyl ester carboxylesterase
MIEAQRQLVTQGLGINHLAVVLGTSMGGMHAWLWAEKYPEMIDTLIPIACLCGFAYSQIRRLSAWPGLGCTTDFQDGFSPKTKAARTWGTSVLAPTKRRGRERSDRDSAG